MQRKITLFVIDDHPVVRAGLRELLGVSPDIDLIADANDAGDETVARIVELRPEVVVTDIKMRGRSGIQLCSLLKREPFAPKVVLLSAFWDDTLIAEALDAGADGYLLKNAEHFDLARGVRAAAAGDPFFDPEISAAVVRQVRGEQGPYGAELSTQDVCILRHVADGLTNKAIGELMFLSHHTIRDRVSAIMAVLGARNRTQAVQAATKRHLI